MALYTSLYMAVYPLMSQLLSAVLQNPLNSFQTAKYFTSGKARAISAARVAKSW